MRSRAVRLLLRRGTVRSLRGSRVRWPPVLACRISAALTLVDIGGMQPLEIFGVRCRSVQSGVDLGSGDDLRLCPPLQRVQYWAPNFRPLAST